jgi:hypothetical protein
MFKQHLRADTHLVAKLARSVSVATDAPMQLEQIDHGAGHPKRLDRGLMDFSPALYRVETALYFLAGPCWGLPGLLGAFAAPEKSNR